MSKLSNVEIMASVLTNICNILSNRTSQSFSVSLLDTIIRALNNKFNFLRFIKFNIKDPTKELISVSSEINSIDPVLIGRAIESIIQIICLDLKEKAGIYFIKEIIKNSSESLLGELVRSGIDLDILKVQQNYIYNQQKRIKKLIESKEGTSEYIKKKGLLNYSWENISDCKYDGNSRVCKIIGKDGNVLDTLDLDKMVNEYLMELTESKKIFPQNTHKRYNKKTQLKI